MISYDFQKNRDISRTPFLGRPTLLDYIASGIAYLPQIAAASAQATNSKPLKIGKPNTGFMQQFPVLLRRSIYLLSIPTSERAMDVLWVGFFAVISAFARANFVKSYGANLVSAQFGNQV